MGKIANRCIGTGQRADVGPNGIGHQCPTCGMLTIPYKNGTVRVHSVLGPTTLPRDRARGDRDGVMRTVPHLCPHCDQPTGGDVLILAGPGATASLEWSNQYPPVETDPAVPEPIAGKTPQQWAAWLDDIDQIEGCYATSNGATVIRQLQQQITTLTAELDQMTRVNETAQEAFNRTLTRAEAAEAQLAALLRERPAPQLLEKKDDQADPRSRPRKVIMKASQRRSG